MFLLVSKIKKHLSNRSNYKRMKLPIIITIKYENFPLSTLAIFYPQHSSPMPMSLVSMHLIELFEKLNLKRKIHFMWHYGFVFFIALQKDCNSERLIELHALIIFNLKSFSIGNKLFFLKDLAVYIEQKLGI